MIRDLKSQKLGSGRNKLSKEQERKLWPFSEADIKIADDATPEQVRVILTKVGSADQYKRIFDEVRRIGGLSEEQVEEHPTLDPNEAVEELLHLSQQVQASTPKSVNNFERGSGPGAESTVSTFTGEILVLLARTPVAMRALFSSLVPTRLAGARALLARLFSEIQRKRHHPSRTRHPKQSTCLMHQ
ncbi:MAG: hypothetical protein ACM3L9_00070 [Deltaproteobacteria bacterium]